MTHLLPPHADLNLAHSSLQTALQIDPNQQPGPPPVQAQPSSSSNSRKRAKKNDPNSDEPPTPAEPRRLRRSHEACARCRSKKIKCDSKHPRCTACATAGVACHQEDRHRQTLIARGHTEHVERRLLLATQLLKRHIPNFEIENLEQICMNEGVDIDIDPRALIPFGQGGPARGFPLRQEGPPPPADGSRFYSPTGQPMMGPPPGYPAQMPLPYSPYPPPPHMPMPGPHPGYNPHVHPAFQHPLPPVAALPQQQIQRPPSSQEVRGQEPLPHDLSNSQALAKNFGVSAAIVHGLKLGPQPAETEDLAVGFSGLSSRRDRGFVQPRDTSQWIQVSLPSSATVTPRVGSDIAPSITIWLPKDRGMVQTILNVYFARLNYHRPIFIRSAFERDLDALYNGTLSQHDPGFVCSIYLMLALGTLSELNHRATERDKNSGPRTTTIQGVLIPDWPLHEEFFECALAVKPDLRVTLSSLQALILLHWYLYTERQGRTLWRLVGSLVRLSIELGLHHDPTVPPSDETPELAFTEEECQLRIRLWAIVLVHDRGTSILLGRPLAIAPSDSNTPRPSRWKGDEISEHFTLSAPIAEIQADIINSLYSPNRPTTDSIMRHAIRIIKSMVDFRRRLPESYKWYFSNTEEWQQERRIKLVEEITEDQGLTLLKLGITRILLLRALFSSKELPYPQRHRALIDAIVASHNIIVIHNQLIKFSDIAFFVSPIPLHIAAMVILYGHMSKTERLTREVSMEDVWMALDMLPHFRWRWERKDLNGGHPLIARVAEEVLKVGLHEITPKTKPMLLSETDWESEGVFSPSMAQGVHPTTPTMGPAQYPPGQYTSPNTSSSSGIKNSNAKAPRGSNVPMTADKKLAEVPPGWFYPFYPETQSAATQDIHRLMNVAQPLAPYGYQPSQDSFVLEEKDPSLTASASVWNSPERRATMQSYPMQPPQI